MLIGATNAIIVNYDRRRSKPWVHSFRMLRPLRFASCVHIATLSPTAMVFEWPSRMVFLPHPVAVLLRSHQDS